MPGTPPARYAFLGPAGTFAEAALRTIPAARTADLQPQPTVAAALEAVRRGEADAALVPLENSVEGGVAATLDELAGGEPLIVVREVLLPVTFALMVRPGTGLAAVHRIATHPHAEAQCRRWVSANVPGAVVVPSLSTAGAAAVLAQDEAAPYDAAIAPRTAAERYRLDVLADDIGDNPDAVTRFVLVSRPAAPPLPSGHDRTSLVLFMRNDHSGALMEILTEFAVRGINLTRIESRPTGEQLGRYCFSVDCEGHVDDERVGEALMGLRRVCSDVRFLGSYPRADAVPEGTVRRGTADADFRDAQAWLSRVREGRTS